MPWVLTEWKLTTFRREEWAPELALHVPAVEGFRRVGLFDSISMADECRHFSDKPNTPAKEGHQSPIVPASPRFARQNCQMAGNGRGQIWSRNVPPKDPL